MEHRVGRSNCKIANEYSDSHFLPMGQSSKRQSGARSVCSTPSEYVLQIDYSYRSHCDVQFSHSSICFRYCNCGCVATFRSGPNFQIINALWRLCKPKSACPHSRWLIPMHSARGSQSHIEQSHIITFCVNRDFIVSVLKQDICMSLASLCSSRVLMAKLRTPFCELYRYFANSAWL